jgi:hypothetical protein
VEVAVAIPGIKRLDRNRDKEIALSIVTSAFASCRVANAINLMQRVRDVIREGGLFKDPLMIGRRSDLRER